MNDSNGLTPLAAAEPVVKVNPDAAQNQLQLDNEVQTRLDTQVQRFVDDVLNAGLHQDTFKSALNTIHSLGAREMRDAAAISNRLLSKPARILNQGAFADSGFIGNAIQQLQQLVEELDPGKYGNLNRVRKLFGLIPMGNRLNWYFAKYQSSQAQINHIVEALYRCQDEIKKDNAGINQEKSNLWGAVQRLHQCSYIGKRIDTLLSETLPQINSKDSERARVIEQDILFPLRQAQTDVLTQQAVSLQGYQAMEHVLRNNRELDKGISRATTTTISALRTAIMVAGSLTNQEHILGQVTALNRSVASSITAASRGIKHQAGRVQQMSDESNTEIDRLQQAFNHVHEAISSVADFKQKALDNMAQSFDNLSREIEVIRQQRETAEMKAINPSPMNDDSVENYFHFTD